MLKIEEALRKIEILEKLLLVISKRRDEAEQEDLMFKKTIFLALGEIDKFLKMRNHDTRRIIEARNFLKHALEVTGDSYEKIN